MAGRRALRAQPPAPWHVRLGRAVLRWTGRLVLGALAGGVVVGATMWAGTSWEAARWLGAAAAVVVVSASGLAATLPLPPGADDDGPTGARSAPPDAS